MSGWGGGGVSLYGERWSCLVRQGRQDPSTWVTRDRDFHLLLPNEFCHNEKTITRNQYLVLEKDFY